MCMPDSKGVGQNFAPVETIGPSGEHTSHTEVEVNNTQVQDLEMTSILYFWRKLTSDGLRVVQRDYARTSSKLRHEANKREDRAKAREKYEAGRISRTPVE